ncbi:cytoplasmic tRNA 2-thiolation protein 2 isoform X2 [Denticeps clupeoides]|nr:cytoplasmic tRNA 2-thiolation protein 2 isoform X2 [Denticeps clupeoides]
MCQVDEEYSGLIRSKPSPISYKKCVKCKHGSAVLTIRSGDGFCRGCFKDYFIHKFRAMLGKNRIIFPGERVLLAVSGGLASSSMLSQVQEGLSHDASKKLRFIPGIIYVDEGGAIGLSTEERKKTISQLEDIFQNTSYPYHIVPFEEIFRLPASVLETMRPTSDHSVSSYKWAVAQFTQDIRTGQSRESRDPSLEDCFSGLDTRDWSQKLPPSADHTEALKLLFASVKTLTAKEDLLQTLRLHLILYVARQAGYTKIMVGDSCSRLAVKLLSSIALGRGAALAMDTGFSDPRYDDVIIVRPMRDYSSKEIAFYNRMFSVPSVFSPSLDTMAPDKASIQRLTETFLTKLQTDFPSTVSTIYRTSEKLHTAHPPQSSDAHPAARCLLCLCALDTTADDCSALHATLQSEWLSQNRGRGNSPVASGPNSAPDQCCSSVRGCATSVGGGGGGSCCSSSNQMPVSSDLMALLCYSCRLTIKDMATVATLPQYVVTEADRRKRR